MKGVGSRFIVIALFALSGACQSPTRATATGYAGQWSGTTAQASSIAFTVAANEMVTSITIGHAFNGYSGSQTFSNLSVSIAPRVECIPGPCPASVSAYHAFNYASGSSIDEPSTAVNAVFLSNDRAEGTLNFRGFPGCGSAIGVPWAASR
jgi:hypothetical protein